MFLQAFWPGTAETDRKKNDKTDKCGDGFIAAFL